MSDHRVIELMNSNTEGMAKCISGCGRGPEGNRPPRARSSRSFLFTVDWKLSAARDCLEPPGETEVDAVFTQGGFQSDGLSDQVGAPFPDGICEPVRVAEVNPDPRGEIVAYARRYVLGDHRWEPYDSEGFKVIGGRIPSAKAGSDPLRIAVGELNRMLGRPDLVIVYVRDPISWSKSEGKTVGALREDPERVDSWADGLPRDKTIVLYCA